MKKIKIEFKYLMIALVVIAGVLLAVSGSFSETKTMTAYKTTVDGSDSARVAKWDVVGVSRKNAQEMELESGFAEEISSNGDWYFEIENLSEVNAMLSKDSQVTFRLVHDSFNNFTEEEISWDFIDGKENPIVFQLFAYDKPLDEILKYININDENDIITYDAYMEKKDDEKILYVETFIGQESEQVEVCKIDTNMTNTFEKKEGVIDEVSQTYYQLTFDFADVADNICSLGFGANRKNTTFRLHWEVPTQCPEHKDEDNDGDCDICSEVMTSETFSYEKYIISDTTTVEGYTPYSVNSTPVSFKDENGDTQYILISEDVDFFDYQKYTSTLGGEPMYKFLNDLGTQTLLIPHSELNDKQKNAILSYSLSANSDVNQAQEKLTYIQYEKFQEDYASVQSNLSYMSYGIKMQIIFDLTVEQVD